MFSYLCTRKSNKQITMKDLHLQLTDKEFNVLLFAINTRLQAIRGFNAFEEERLESIKNTLLENDTTLLR